MIVSVGVVSMLWRLVDKHSSIVAKLHGYLVQKLRLPATICTICVSFWLHLTYFLVMGQGATMSLVMAFACTPFTLELSKSIWH